MKRREFLKETALAGSALLMPGMLRWASAGALPVQELRDSFGAAGGSVLLPTDRDYAAYRIAFNKRTMQAPAAIAACNTAQAVSAAIQWARKNEVPLRMRAGGHSYEGFSQGTGLVIDTRRMNEIEVDASAGTASIGAGAALGQVYAALYQHKLTIPAGSCPTVGITGHTLGGGYGLLGRKFGLACDSLRAVELVDAEGRVLRADAAENPDLFWALRGGGGGSFGIVTRLEYDLHPIDTVTVCGVGWLVPEALGHQILAAWQAWAPQAPDELTSLLTITKDPSGKLNLHVSGQYVGSAQDLSEALHPFLSKAPAATPHLASMPFDQAVAHFSGGHAYPSVYMKGKSDYATAPMSDAGIATLLRGIAALPAGGVGLIIDSYGGAINRVAREATAFAHRDGTLYSMQYFSQWYNPADTATRLQYVRGLYESMRPYVSGYSYVNYCDLDLKDYGHAYWGDNLARLKQIKASVDPGNVFHHAQSIPLT